MNTSGLFCEIFWGEELSEARSFGAEVDTVLAAADERAPLPLYGFTLEVEPFTLARRTDAGFRVYVPPRASVERRTPGGGLEHLASSQLPQEGGRGYVDVSAGELLQLREGELRLVVQPATVAGREAGARWRVALVVAIAVAATVTLPLGFLLSRPTKEEADALTVRAKALAREHQEAERKRLEALYPTHVETDGGVPDARERLKLPSSITVR